MNRNSSYAVRATVLATLALVTAAACADQGPLAPAGPRPGGPQAIVNPAGCRVNDGAFTSGFRNDVNLDLNDYARIFADAENASCAEGASTALTAKVKATMDAAPTKFTEWLQGANVALIFAAANRIGANGFATQALDTQLRRVETAFAAGRDLGCTKESGNQCVDDYSIAASGYAWIAAYKYRRGDASTGVESFRSKARTYIDSTFTAVCIHQSAGTPTLCNGVAGVNVGGVPPKTLSLNHGQQMPSYGFGLMTSIAATVLGLEASGAPYTFSSTKKYTVSLLFEEMQRAVLSTPADSFATNCVSPYKDGSGNWQLGPATYYCGGPDKYKPQMYRLDKFFTTYITTSLPTAGTYTSNSFNDNDFLLGSFDNGFYSWGRHQTYGKLGYDWIQTPREYLPFDSYDPIGYLDGVSATGVASGWTCDKDVPTKSNRVDLYSGGTFAAYGYANGGSEPAVNSLCNGGTAHRFAVQLPSWTQGQDIVAYGLDYTWFGFTQLTCLQSPRCAW
ncbi:hypothetical protein [Longimicrobium sp.]|uniref:hypothetical protein n=1 Tax=Longimicrobium sp. TaxID=2029185 RepID=UPI002D020956|nr:hypothetical protein [Longimicrobium sp.]HSU14728.1 hypothetical protein [Longimicrobium sp.]